MALLAAAVAILLGFLSRLCRRPPALSQPWSASLWSVARCPGIPHISAHSLEDALFRPGLCHWPKIACGRWMRCGASPRESSRRLSGRPRSRPIAKRAACACAAWRKQIYTALSPADQARACGLCARRERLYRIAPRALRLRVYAARLRSAPVERGRQPAGRAADVPHAHERLEDQTDQRADAARGEPAKVNYLFPTRSGLEFTPGATAAGLERAGWSPARIRPPASRCFRTIRIWNSTFRASGT